MSAGNGPTRLIVAAIAAATVASVLLVCCGCGGKGHDGADSGNAGSGNAAVALVPPRPAPAVTARCAALVRTLPARLQGRPRRAVRPSSSLTAAWGNPPIALRCGVPLPAALTPTTELTVVNGVSWFPQPPGSATPTRFTEVGREGYVELTIPGRYAPAGPILVAISNALAPVIAAKPDGRI